MPWAKGDRVKTAHSQSQEIRRNRNFLTEFISGIFFVIGSDMCSDALGTHECCEGLGDTDGGRVGELDPWTVLVYGAR